MSEMETQVYSFWSRSMQVMHCYSKGERVSIEFSTPFEGVSRYTTRKPEVAEAIRNSYEFEIGNIVEDTVEQKESTEQTIQRKVPVKPRMVTMAEPESSWLEMSMGGAHEAKTKKDPMKVIINDSIGEAEESKTLERVRGERVKEAEQMNLFPDILDTYQHNGADKSVEGVVSTEEKENTEGADKTMILEDVQSYMEAKEYLKSVVGVSADKIRTKADVVRFCQETGIEFPNYKL